jgi:hypothetical protein
MQGLKTVTSINDDEAASYSGKLPHFDLWFGDTGAGHFTNDRRFS